ncbi:5-(carboxyamino)imidazole ribonucleotide synthase [bacterium]|nr:5-(carboxyamino)imidazole ribonucleotide synthase [bacterium]
MKTRLLPGSRIGILGGGQLGRMLAMSARRMGYGVWIYTDVKDSPAAPLADSVTVAAYDDAEALAAFARQVHVVTFEFENIPFAAASQLEKQVLVRPSPKVLHIAQHRGREKAFLSENGFPIVPYAHVRGPKDVAAALEVTGLPAVLKTAGFGYDGKGQTKIQDRQALEDKVVGGGDWVLEQWQAFDKEVSVLVARNPQGEMADWGVVENRHKDHILDVSVVPPVVPKAVAQKAVQVARGIAVALDLVGLLCVEFFVGKDGCVRVNEMAPRPHNSGHWTIEGAVTSQFEQQIRAVIGAALGSTEILSPTAMANVLGDCWLNGEPRWSEVLDDPHVKWHSYGKTDPRKGRKMGHLTSVGATAEEAVGRVLAARQRLTP